MYQQLIFLIYLFLIGEWLLYNVGLVSDMHQHESVIGMCPLPLEWLSFPPPTQSYPCGLSQSTYLQIGSSVSFF